jgi:transposase
MYTRQASGERKVETGDGTARLAVHLVGPHPILKHFLGKMDFHATVSHCLGRSREGFLDHSQSLSLLVKNILLSPAPLYRIAQWAEPVDPAALGLSRADMKFINDDRIARALDALASPRGRSLFFHLAVHIIRQFELDTRRIHNDTTTVTFFGQYEKSVAEPKITHGMNKDHRPDMKQLVFGLNVTADGAVPLSHEVYSGNRNDDTIHRGNLEKLRQILGRDDFVYVADSKLCTRKNLSYMEKYGGKFVTVMPRSRAEDRRMRDLLRQGRKIRWRKTLVIPNKRRRRDPPDVYWTSADLASRSSENFRIVWCRSSQKARIDALARDTDLRKTEIELHDLGARLNRGRLKRKAAVKKAARTILDQRKCGRFLHVTVTSRQVTRTVHVRRGRPRPGDPVREIRSRVLALAVHRDKQALKAEARTDGVFPLLSNMEKISRKQVLLIYKYQPYVEKRHALFKTELGVAPVFIKKPHRAAGLIHATFLAMMVDALIERTVRLSMIRKGITHLPLLPEGRLTKTPTTARVLEAFSDVAWYEFRPPDIPPLTKCPLLTRSPGTRSEPWG